MTTETTPEQDIERINLLNRVIVSIEDYLYSFDPTEIVDALMLDSIIEGATSDVLDATYEIEELLSATTAAVDG